MARSSGAGSSGLVGLGLVVQTEVHQVRGEGLERGIVLAPHALPHLVRGCSKGVRV